MPSILPSFKYTVPILGHVKERPYIDFPIIYEATQSNVAFYVEHPFTICTSSFANTTLYKWNGIGWSTISGWTNPEKVYGMGFFAVTTSANATVIISEHVNDPPR